MNEYHSVVYYQVKQPRWMETVKVIMILTVTMAVNVSQQVRHGVVFYLSDPLIGYEHPMSNETQNK